MTTIGKNLRYIRKQNKLSQTEFAQLFGLTRASVGAYEEFRAKPKDELINRVAKFFNIESNELEFSDFESQNKATQTTIEKPKIERKPQFIQVENLFQNQDESIPETPKKIHQKPKEKKPEKSKQWTYFSQGVEEKRAADQFPFLKSCDAVFELSPFIEREKGQFQDGAMLFGYKLNQVGQYNGIFIVKENQRWFLKEGDFFLQTPTSEVWRITYILDSINSY